MRIRIPARWARRVWRTLLTLSVAIAGAAHAQVDNAARAFPDKPIRVIAPFPPGSAGDIVPRIIGQSLGEEFKQNIVVDNRPGAGGNIAAETVKNSTPDGYTLMLVTIGTHAINKSLYSRLPYDPIKDFAPVVLVGSSPNILVVTPSLPLNSVRALAVTSPQRHAALPDVPAMNETLPGFEVTGWYGFVAPAHTPASIVNKLNAGFVKVLKTKELRERMAAQGIDPLTSTPEEFSAHIRNEVVKWEKVVKASGAKVD